MPCSQEVCSVWFVKPGNRVWVLVPECQLFSLLNKLIMLNPDSWWEQWALSGHHWETIVRRTCLGSSVSKPVLRIDQALSAFWRWLPLLPKALAQAVIGTTEFKEGGFASGLGRFMNWDEEAESQLSSFHRWVRLCYLNTLFYLEDPHGRSRVRLQHGWCMAVPVCTHLPKPLASWVWQVRGHHGIRCQLLELAYSCSQIISLETSDCSERVI